MIGLDVSAHSIEARHTVEMEFRLIGTFRPGCEAWGGSRFERPTNPPEPDSVEDIDIVEIGTLTPILRPHPRGAPICWRFDSILEGVDRKSEAYQRIVRNILALIEDDASQALLAEVA